MFFDKTISILGISATLILGFGENASAFSIYASNSSGQIGIVDPDTGEFNSFFQGNIPFTDIAVTEDGNLFGSSYSNLYSIDKNEGSSTLIGKYNSLGINALGFTDSNVLYGASPQGGFYQIDATTGSSSLISGSSGFRSAGDIVYDADQNLFWGTSTSNKLVTIGRDGSFNEIGDIGFSGVYGIFFNEGTLFGHTIEGQQITLDMTTGQGTFDKQIIGDNTQIWGSASLPSSGVTPNPQPVPEPASVLGLLGLVAFWTTSRSRHKHQNSVNISL